MKDNKHREGSFTAEQLEQHRPEIENRIRNLFWTVSGDYSLDIRPDVETFAHSRAQALWDTIKQGAFARYFRGEELAMYAMKKCARGGKEPELMELLRLCVDAAVYPPASRERGGIREIREQVFRELWEEPAVTVLEQIRRGIVGRFLGEDPRCGGEILTAVERIEGLSHAGDTRQIIAVADGIYNALIDPDFSEQGGDLDAVMAVTREELLEYQRYQELSDDQMQRVLEEYLTALKEEMLRGKPRDPAPHRQLPQSAAIPDGSPEPSPADREKVYAYIRRQFGTSYLTPQEQERRTRKFCTGLHGRCSLYFTDGILSNPALKNTQYLRSRMQNMKNEMYFNRKRLAIHRSVEALASMLRQVQIRRQEEDTLRAETGALNPARLWKVGRTADNKLFDTRKKRESAGFVVDILMDSSSSQTIRQPQIAAQGYIISQALSLANIPHRVCGFCSYWDYTMLHRFRDYDDPAPANRNLLQFRAFGENRDGLAIRTVCGDLAQRREEHKLLIVLSDGRPNHLGTIRPGSRNPAPYVGEEAVKDTAREIRKARNQGICVLGVFVGNEADLYAEKKIFGKEFTYTRNISSFAHIVGAYLRKQLEQDL